MDKISRRTILSTAGVGTAAAAAAALIGHRVSWEGSFGSYPVQPYTLSQGAIETFKIRERISMRIDGVGHDVVNMTGTAVFRRHNPQIAAAAAAAGLSLNWATATVSVDFLQLDTAGTSSVFGAVHASLAGGAYGALVQPLSSSSFAQAAATPAAVKTCDAIVGPKFALPDLGQSVSVGEAGVKLASRVSLVPPVGDVARTTGSYPLYSADGRQIGVLLGADIEIGEIVKRESLSSDL